jgi:putative spermidine/putrescine transport system substrate-binding protein
MRNLKIIGVIVVFCVAFAYPALAKEQLAIQIWPGSYEEIYTKYVIEPFEKQYDVDVVAATGVEWFTLAKITEEIASGKPRLDVVEVTVSDYMRGKKMDLWEELNLANIPNSQNLHENFKDSHGLGFETYTMGLIFNTDSGKPTPTSLEDLWNPDYRVAIIRTHEQYFLPMVSHMLTGRYTPIDLDKVFAKLDELRPHIIAVNESFAEFRNLLANDEMDLGPAFNNRGGRMLDDGMKVEYITFPSIFIGADYWGVVKGTQHKDLAEKFIDFTLNVESQKANVENQYLGPTSLKVQLSDDFVKTRGVAYGKGLEGKLTMEDYAYIAEHLDEWSVRWQKWLAGF